MTFTITVPFTSETLEWDNLHPKAQVYLAQYGLNKTLQDSVSGMVKAATEAFMNRTGKTEAAFIKAQHKAVGIVPADFPPADDSDRAVAEAAKAYADKCVSLNQTRRLASVLAGEMEPPGTIGPRLRGIDAVMHAVAEEALRKVFASKAMKWPKEASEVRRLTTAYIAKYDATVRAEAQRRIDADLPQDDGLDDFLSDLLGDDNDTNDTNDDDSADGNDDDAPTEPTAAEPEGKPARRNRKSVE